MITAQEAKDLTAQALEESLGPDTLGYVSREIKRATSNKEISVSISALTEAKATDLGRLCALYGYEAELHRNGALGNTLIIRWSDEANN